MDILITGISGFVGTHLCDYFVSSGYNVYGTYRTYDPSKVFWKMGVYKKVSTLVGDLLDFNFTRNAITWSKPEVVIHLAAVAHVRVCNKDPVTTYNTNIIGTVNILEACRILEVPKVIVFSTDKVYGNRINAKEEDSLVSTDHYSSSKIAADYIARTYMDLYDMNIIVVRPCNIYGYDTGSRIIPNVIRKCILGRRPEIFRQTKDNKRQYIYIKDLARAVQLLLEKVDKGVFNIGTNDVLSQEEVVKTICEFFKIDPVYVDTPKEYVREIREQSVDWSKIRSLGFRPKYSFARGIEETINYFKLYGL